MTERQDEVLFHHYALSPFSEKIRKVFALKNVAYRAVEQPMWMPKPHLTPLTGGYRRIPVMQIGADVYCDTALICRVLESLFPAPTLYPDGNVAAIEATAAWADRQLFLVVVPIVFGALADVLPKELIDDRKRMRPDLDVGQLRAASPALRGALHAWCKRLDQTLEARKFLFGSAFSLADAAVYHCLWFARNDPQAAAELSAHAHLGEWMSRIDAMGSGAPSELAPEEALRVAAAAEPRFRPGVAASDASGLREGMRVGVFADDLPSDVFEGTLRAACDDEIVLVRSSRDLGEVALHFPRVGYLLRAA
jgi:glutathione S-transferase